MLNHPMPGQPVKVQADMGSDNARVVHEHGGFLSDNPRRLVERIAWVSFDDKSNLAGKKGRNGEPARPRVYFESSVAAARVIVPTAKNEATAVKAVERARQALAKLGIIRRVERGIPNKQTAMYELDLDRLIELSKGLSQSPTWGHLQSLSPTDTDADSPQTVGDRDDQSPPYEQALTNQVQASNQPSRLTTRSRRAVSSPRAREPKLLAQDDDASAYDQARQHLGNLSPEHSERVMAEARQALGPDAPLPERIMHAAQLAGHNQEREAS